MHTICMCRCAAVVHERQRAITRASKTPTDTTQKAKKTRKKSHVDQVKRDHGNLSVSFFIIIHIERENQRVYDLIDDGDDDDDDHGGDSGSQ